MTSPETRLILRGPEESPRPLGDALALPGTGLYETIRLQRGAPIGMDRHLARLLASAEALGLTREGLRQEAGALASSAARAWGASEGVLKLVLHRTVSGPPGLWATLEPKRAPLPGEGEEGISLGIARVRRSAEALAPRHKTLARIEEDLARAEARAGGHADALVLDADGRPLETTTMSIVWRRGERLYTPSLQLPLLPGTMRALVIELARARGVEVVEGAHPLEALLEADEAFATNALRGCVRVRAIGGRGRFAEPSPLRERLARDVEARAEAESSVGPP